MIDLAIHHILLQAILWNTVAQHTAWLGLHLENFAVVALQRQVIGAGKSRRTSANNSHLFTGRWVLDKGNRWVEQAGFGGMAVHSANSYLFLNQRAATGLLARRGT